MLGLSLAVLLASGLTLREDMRFQSRPLSVGEQNIVDQSLRTWRYLGVEGKLVEQLQPEQIRAMDSSLFTRAQERSAYGYTNKSRRILLNPDLCFAVYYLLGPTPDGTVDEADLVPTLATLYHETLHLLFHAPEDEAYLREWRFVRALGSACAGYPPRQRLLRELNRWADEMPARLTENLGSVQAQRLRSRL